MQAKNISILILLLSVSIFANAQEIHLPEKMLMSVSSPKGNYIYFFDGNEISGSDTAVQKNTSYFIIERAKFDVKATEIKKNVFKKIGEPSMVKSVKELNKIYGAAQLKEVQKILGQPTEQAVADFFNTKKQLELYPILYDFIETKEALGHVFLDENVTAGEVYLYVVKRMTAGKITEDWGYAITQSKSGNYYLPYYKPQLSNIEAQDSSVAITWQLPIPEGKLNSIPIPKSNIDKDSITGVLKIRLSPTKTRAKVYIEKNGKFIEADNILPVLNETSDTITYMFTKRCMPEETVTAYLVTEDEVYNIGIESDTAIAYAIEQKSVPLIYGIRVTDVLNGIQLSWDKLPAKPYITGIEIYRFNSNEQYDSVATVPAGVTSFIDYKAEVSQHYRYKVKALFLPQTGIEQAIPAEGVGTFTMFSKPLPANNVTIENKNGMPLVKWDSITDPSFYGSFIYRGTSAKNLEVVAGPITANYFIDSASHLSGRSEYYYAVINQNLREDTSVFSDIVKIIPDKKIETTNPSTVDFYYVNGSLRISWNDVRTMDNAIESFVVQKKTSTEKVFTPLAATNNNYTEDSFINKGVTYEYRVAAITYRGDTSEYSNAHTFFLQPNEIPQVDIFYTRNIKEGIEISWPTVAYENRKSYNVYRRLATDEKFVKIATVPSNTFLYVDKNVDENKMYVYKISVTQNDNKEGEQGKSVSLRRLKK